MSETYYIAIICGSMRVVKYHMSKEASQISDSKTQCLCSVEERNSSIGYWEKMESGEKKSFVMEFLTPDRIFKARARIWDEFRTYGPVAAPDYQKLVEEVRLHCRATVPTSREKAEMEKNHNGQYALFIITTKQIYLLDLSPEPNDKLYERWLQSEHDTYGDPILHVYQCEVLKHQCNILGESEERRFPRFWDDPPATIIKTKCFQKVGTAAIKRTHPKGTELAVTTSGTWRLRSKGDKPGADFRIQERVDKDGFLTVSVPAFAP